MRKKVKYYLWWGGYSIIVLPLGLFLMNKCNKEMEIYEKREFPSIRKTDQEYKGTIMKKKMGNVWKNSYRITLTNGQQFLISSYSFLEPGDSIFRPAKSDTLYLYSLKKGYKESRFNLRY